MFLNTRAAETEPMFSRELFFQTPDQRIMVAPYTVEGDSFRADKPHQWSDVRFIPRQRQRSFDLHPDGDRFVLAPVSETLSTAEQDKVVLVFNFFEELKRLVPAKR